MDHVLLDTGPLVALFSMRESSHAWVAGKFAALTAPCVTCEAVLTEAFHLLAKVRGGHNSLSTALQEGLILLDFNLHAELAPVMQLMECYADVPMSLADACLVRMSELSPQSKVFTLDEDFRVYRKRRNETIDLIAPFS